MKSSFLGRTAMAAAAIGMISWTTVSRADDVAMVFQYELALGGHRPVRTFYFAYQPDGASQAMGMQTDLTPAVRVPLYSTDRHMTTTFSFLSLRADDGGQTSAGDALSEVLAILAGLTLYVGVPIYAAVQEYKKAEAEQIAQIDLPDLDIEPLQMSAGNGKQ